MTKIVALIILTGVTMPLMAQDFRNDYDTTLLFLDEYPYTDVLKYIGFPDTLFFCHYPLKRYEEKNTPTAINLFLYRKNGEWWATTLVKFKTRGRGSWKLTKPTWIQTDLTEKLEIVLLELNEVSYTEHISTIYSWAYVKYGTTIISKDLIGNLRDYFDRLPNFSFILTVCFFESYNQHIVKSYR